MLAEYLPAYGNNYWKTPNIDELISKGTIFYRHYTAAPSTSMSFNAMITGKYPYQFDRKKYSKVREEYPDETIFDIATKLGAETHIVWSDNYQKVVLPYTNCFRNTIIHTLNMNQSVGPHISGLHELSNNDDLLKKILDALYKIIDGLPKDNIFLWVHLPHVIQGRCCYGGDIDVLDEIIGHLRNIYGDSSIYISADHGNMNGYHNKYVYGFHLNEPAIRIPLITPKINDVGSISFPTSNTQLKEILFENHISQLKYIISETTYYLQANRKIAIIMDSYKYIYDKLKNTTVMYDLGWDPSEEHNLLQTLVYDEDRKLTYNVKEIYFYPKYDLITKIYGEFSVIFGTIWRIGNIIEEFLSLLTYKVFRVLNPIIEKYKFKKKTWRH